MRNALAGAIALIPIVLPFAAAAQDVVVMRRTITSNVPARDARWKTGDWAWAPGAAACGSAVRQTRSVTCESSGRPMDERFCTTAKPAATQDVARLDACPRDWIASGWGEYRPACSGAAYREQTVACSVIAGSETYPADAGECDPSRKPSERQGPTANYTTCTGTWSVQYVEAGTCTSGKVTQNPVVTCRRPDGAVDTAACDPTKKPNPQPQQATCTQKCGSLESGIIADYWNMVQQNVAGTIAGDTLEQRLDAAQAACSAALPDEDWRYSLKRLCGYDDDSRRILIVRGYADLTRIYGSVYIDNGKSYYYVNPSSTRYFATCQ